MQILMQLFECQRQEVLFIPQKPLSHLTEMIMNAGGCLSTIRIGVGLHHLCSRRVSLIMQSLDKHSFT